MFDAARLLHRLRLDEGFRADPYLCSAGVWTIGYGTTRLYGEPVTATTPRLAPEDALILLQADAFKAVEDCQVIYGEPFNGLDPVRQEVLICLAYQLGRGGLSRFTKMNEAIRVWDYRGWQRELKDSKVYRQATNRIDRYLAAIADARWPEGDDFQG